MSKVFDWSRRLWLEVKLGAPSALQRPIVEVKDIARLAYKPRYTLYQWQGQNQGGSLTATCVGLEYTRQFFKNILFAETPVEKTVGRLPFWKLGELAGDLASDIVIIETVDPLVRRFTPQSAIVLPAFVYQILDLTGSWEEVQRRFHRSARGQDMRRVRKYGYQYEVSHNAKDFEMFYHKMYLPSMIKQHGALADPMSFEEAYHYFQHGWLFLVKRDGINVSGSLCHTRGDLINYYLVGILDGDEQLMREGAQGAIYHAMIHWGNRNGYRTIDFLGSKPYLDLGVFQYKRKWGAAVHVRSNMKRRIWIKLQRNTPAVRQFMSDNPCIVMDEKRQLYGLIAVDDPKAAIAENEAEWRKRYENPGLKGLLVRSVDDFFGTPEFITKVDPATSIMFKEAQ